MHDATDRPPAPVHRGRRRWAVGAAAITAAAVAAAVTLWRPATPEVDLVDQRLDTAHGALDCPGNDVELTRRGDTTTATGHVAVAAGGDVTVDTVTVDGSRLAVTFTQRSGYRSAVGTCVEVTVDIDAAVDDVTFSAAR